MGDVVVIVTYYRVSTEEQSKRGYSLSEQRRECLARAHKIAGEHSAKPEIHEFTDTVSGELLERPGLEECRAFIRQQPVQYFVCLDADRFSRSLLLQMIVADELRSARVQMVFVQQNYEDTASGRLFFQVHGAIAEFEKAKIRERLTRGRVGKLRDGGIPNRVKPWGYVWDSTVHSLRIDQDQAPWVERVYQWHVDGWSYQRIASKLMELGVAAPGGGKQWYRATVKGILDNSTYMGRLVLNRWDCSELGILKHVKKSKRGRPLTAGIKPVEEWFTVQAPAIISEDLWVKAQTRKAERKRLAHRGIGLLSGLCVCGICGRGMHYMGSVSPRRLRCVGRYPRKREGGPEIRNADACISRDIRSATIEEELWELIKRWITLPNELARELERRKTEHPTDRMTIRRITEVERELEAKRNEHRRTFDLAKKGLAPDGVEAELELLKRQVRALEAEVVELRTLIELPEQDTGTKLAATFEMVAAELGEELNTIDISGQQRLVRMLIREIRLWPDGRWEYQFK